MYIEITSTPIISFFSAKYPPLSPPKITWQILLSNPGKVTFKKNILLHYMWQMWRELMLKPCMPLVLKNTKFHFGLFGQDFNDKVGRVRSTSGLLSIGLTFDIRFIHLKPVQRWLSAHLSPVWHRTRSLIHQYLPAVLQFTNQPTLPIINQAHV